MAEPLTSRWRRRVVTVPTMLAATSVALLGLPVVLPAAAIADVARGRFQLPTVRIYLFLLQYLVNDSVEIVAAPIYWVMAGFGTGLGRPASLARHERLQWWSMKLLAVRAERLLGLRFDVDDESRQALAPGPVIVISRHVSLFDASIPGLVYADIGFRVRGVIMAELLADPGFDLLYGRLGSVFVPRDDGQRARAEIERMAATTTADTALVIFPEGRLFLPAVRDRSLARLAETDPERAARLAGLANLLPPRPGGLLGLLGAVPEADVVLIDHRGLDRFGRLADLVGAVPVDRAVRVTARRIPRSEIPVDVAEQVVWLDELWLALDARLGAPATGS